MIGNLRHDQPSWIRHEDGTSGRVVKCRHPHHRRHRCNQDFGHSVKPSRTTLWRSHNNEPLCRGIDLRLGRPLPGIPCHTSINPSRRAPAGVLSLGSFGRRPLSFTRSCSCSCCGRSHLDSPGSLQRTCARSILFDRSSCHSKFSGVINSFSRSQPSGHPFIVQINCNSSSTADLHVAVTIRYEKVHFHGI